MTDGGFVKSHTYSLRELQPPDSPRPKVEWSGSVSLAVRFWDPVADLPVYEGLVVTARPVGTAGALTRGVAAGAATWVFYKPELAEESVVQVFDARSRFLPAAIRLTGADTANRGEPVYLDAAPSQPGEPGFRVVRGQLWDADAKAPAAHAVLEAFDGRDPWRAVSDPNGYFALVLPEARFKQSLTAGAPQRSHSLTVRVKYSGTVSVPEGLIAPLREAIDAQPYGQICPTEGQFQTEWQVTLSLDRSLVLQTDNLSRLQIRRGQLTP